MPHLSGPFIDSISLANGTRRTDKAAQVTADAFLPQKVRTAARGIGIGHKFNRLMPTIAAGDITSATTYTLVVVKLGIDQRVAVEVGG